MTLRIAFVAEGDAETADCWSGCANGFVRALRQQGVQVEVVDAELRSWTRAPVALRTFSPNRRRWRARYLFEQHGFRERSRIAARKLSRLGGHFDAIVQAGATFAIPAEVRKQTPSVVYADSNVALARRAGLFAGVGALANDVALGIAEREQRVYDAATRLWAWSDCLASSFADDFGQPVGKIRTIYAGANTVPSSAGGAPDRRRPIVLFVGKDHRRKGSAVVLEAFKSVKRAIPEAELHFVGGVPEVPENAGVVCHGILAGDAPEGREKLRRLYQEATVFCLPSRYEPFGVVFVEAMLAELACVGTDRWAMPEIIEHGVTGWNVPDGNAEALGEVLISALQDPVRTAAMGAAGRNRALELFTWDRVAARAVDDLESLASTQPNALNAIVR